MATQPDRSLDTIPRSLDPFIGRARETSEIVSLLATARLFTLTGTGGSGKSRLAAEVATRCVDVFQDGARWVDLSPLTDPGLVPHVVAARCGIAESGSSTVLDALVATLQPRHLLLVLDNCEHLLPACAHLVEALLVSCPRLHVLAVSREALSIPGEVTWLVAPLRLPEPDHPPSFDDAMTSEAVELFVTRAAAVRPGFRLTEENVASVAHICRQVDGLPLALELAAAQLRVLSIAELAVRLDDAAHILTRGSRTAHPRQQTLRATLDWSYQLLSDTERVVFERLAVFAGSFSLSAAEAICSGTDIAEAAIYESLAHLVEKSLVSIHVQDALDETRYRLLEPLRQYAQSRLTESATELDVRQRHRDWYAAMATQAGMGGPDQTRSLDRLTIEYENIRAALSWSIAHGDTTVAGNIVAEVWPFWQLRGHLHEGRRWLEHLLEAVPESTPLRAQLLWIAGILARPNVALARTRFTESLAIWQALGDQQGIARVSSTLGFVAQAQGDHAQALAYLEQSLPIVRESADTAALARVLTNLALSVLASGDPQRAMSLCLEGIKLNQRIGNLHGAAAAMANLGMIWQARGDEPRAAALWDESLALRRRIGDVGGTADVLVLLGNLAVRQHAYARANDLYLESLALRRQMAVSEGIAPVLEGLAVVGAASDDPEQAVQLAGAADALRTTLGTPLRSNDRNAHDRLLTRLRTRLGPETFRQAWDAGYRLSLDQALAVATGNRVLPGGPGLDSPSSETPAPPTTPARCPAYSLTRREIEVLRLLTHGLTYAQIGEELVISPRTVDAHIRSIFSKLDVRSRTAATRLALQHQLV